MGPKLKKKELAIFLSKLKSYRRPKKELDQYPTPPEIAAELLYIAFLQGDIDGKVVCDLGCGTGILTIGASLLGAREAIGIDVDPDAIEIARENAKGASNCRFICEDIRRVSIRADTVLMNPPYGRWPKHVDRAFLEKAFEIARVIYSIHPLKARESVEKLALKHKFAPFLIKEFPFRIKATFEWHERERYEFEAGIWRFVKL